MSASLVGSEMCIRDRFLYEPCFSEVAFATYQEQCVSSLAGCACENFYPVSYTHLTLPTICSV
eukprot:14386581-Alexandrium_andersonii.AAC.1